MERRCGTSLSLLAVAAGDAFTARATPLHRGSELMGAAEGGAADSHPTWSPNSRWIAFGHGTNSRSGNGRLDYPGALYFVSREGGSAVRLDRANGGPTGTQSYWPTFAPFTTTDPGAGGASHVWLAFHSRRDYGNGLVGTRGTRRRRLWVTAIDTTPAAGSDPSSVPYWLPGQRAAEENMAAYRAPQACRDNGETCRSSAECCSGTCNASGRCEPPPPAMCRTEGRTCSGSADCCAGLTCVGNVCGVTPG